MDEQSYQDFLKLAKSLRQMCADFPAEDFYAYQEGHHSYDMNARQVAQVMCYLRKDATPA